MFGTFYAIISWILYPIEAVLRSVGLLPQEAIMSAGLTEGDKTAVRRTWGLVAKDAQGNGIKLFLKFFKEFPDYQNMFSKLKGLSEDELKKSLFVKMHALRIMQAFTAIIDSLDDVPGLVNILEKNVDDHFPKRITPDHYNNLLNLLVGFQSEELGDAFDDAAREGWVKAAGVMVGIIQSHYSILSREEGLLEQHKTLIRANWVLVGANAEENGINLFIKMFRDFPAYQDMFSKLKGLTVEELKTSSFLKRHALGVVKALSTVVDNLDNTDELVKVLDGLVETHVPRGVTKNHYNNLFRVLLGFLAEALEDRFNSDCHFAWTRAAIILLGIIEAKQTDLGGE